MKRSRLYGIATAVVALLPLSGGAFAAQNEAAKPGEEVSFPASCAAESQKALNQAVWTLHSFWYPEALSGFTNIAKAEPGCAMAYWGIAMSHWYPLWYPPNAAALKAGSEAVEKALAASPKTEREKDYIGAIAAFYRDSDKLDHQTRALAYEKAMEQVYLRFPDDREAGVFYALALNATASPTDKTFANKKKAAEILNKVFAEQQNHPGVAHYLIHSDDTQELAEAGLPAAMCYAKIAPEVPHAQHMPSHIFTRLGLWQESIESNLAGHRAAKSYAEKTYGQGGYDQETVHTLDYLAYASLQTAQDRAAKGVVDEIASLKVGPAPNLPIAYAIAAIPTRYALERRDWAAAAAPTRTTANFPWERFPWAAAMTSFARALGAAHGATSPRRGRRSRTCRASGTRLPQRRTNTGQTRWRCSASGRPRSSRTSKGTARGPRSSPAPRPSLRTRWTSTRRRPGCSFQRMNCAPICCLRGRTPRELSRSTKGAADRPEPLPKRARHGSCRETCWRHRGGCGVVPSGHLAGHESGHRLARARRGQALPDAIGSEFPAGPGSRDGIWGGSDLRLPSRSAPSR